MAARPIGGLCSRALRFTQAGAQSGKSVPLEHVLLQHALGERLTDVAREDRASGVMMIPIPHRGVFRRVDGVAAARRVPLVDDVQITAKTGAALTPLPEGRSYLGFIFASGESPGGVEAALREAHGHLEFTIERELPVIAEAAAP